MCVSGHKESACETCAEQKHLHLEVSQNMLDEANGDDFLNTVVTGDKPSVYGYDPETKVQLS